MKHKQFGVLFVVNIVLALALLLGPFVPVGTAVATTPRKTENITPPPLPDLPESSFTSPEPNSLSTRLTPSFPQQLNNGTVVSPQFPNTTNSMSPRQQNQLNANPLDMFAESGLIGNLQNGVFIPGDPLDTLLPLARDDYDQPDGELAFVANAPTPARMYEPVQSTATSVNPIANLAHAPTQIYLPLIASVGSSAIITPEAGGQVVAPGNASMVVQFDFAAGAVEQPATGQYLESRPHNAPPSLTIVGSGFALSVKDMATQDAISYFPPQIVTGTAVPDPEFDRIIYTYLITPTVKVTINYDESDVWGLQEERVRLYQQNPHTGAWEGLVSAVDTSANIVMADISQDGHYVLLAPHSFTPNLSVPGLLVGTQVLTATQPVVILDPDHGGGDPYGGYVNYPPAFAGYEEEYNLQVANLVKDRLVACGVDVIMTRNGDYYVTLPARTDQINNTNPDTAITLAFDAVNHFMGDNTVTGTGVAAWVDLGEPLQTAFGNAGMSRVNEYTGLRNRGLKDGSWIYVVANVNSDINYTHLELAYMDNYYDRAIMDDPTGMGSIADGAFAAITDILGGESVCTNPGFEFPEPLSQAERDRLWQLGHKNWMRYRWDPVNTTTGNPIQQFTDLAVPGLGGFDLVVERFYNGFDFRPGVFGYNWSSFLDMSLRLASDGSVDARLADGSGIYFTGDGATFTPDQDGVFMDLTRNGPDFMLTTPDQVTYHFIQNGYMAYLVAVNDRWGNSITIERDGNGNPTQIVDSAGRIYTIELLSINENDDFISRITDPIGRVVEYTYDEGTQDLTAVIDTNSGIHQFTYDGDHNLLTITDPDGILYLQNFYDGEGRVIEQLDASGSQGFGSYDASSTTVIDNLNNNTIDEYDSLGRVTTTTDALGNTEHFAYDNDYNVVSYTDKRDHTWTYSYDAQGNLLTETDPLGHVTSYTYDSDNNLTGVTDEGGPNGTARTTTYVYDADGNLTRIENPDGTVIRANYDAYGQMTLLIDAKGNMTFYAYDSEGNLERITDSLGNVTLYGYDAIGRQTGITDANGNTAQFIYDDNDNIVQIVDPKGASTYFVYDDNDNLLEMVDRRGGTTTYTYDENLKLLSETDPEGHTTTYSYDGMYNRVSMTDPNGNETLYRYDSLYQLTEVENALGAITAFNYDENGNVTVVVDALLNGTNFAYDVMNRLESQTDSLSYVTSYAYDAVGRQVSMSNPIGAVTQYEYDVIDRMVRMIDGLGGEWTTAYDANGNVTAQTDANGHSTQMVYDAVDRLIGLMDAGGHATTFSYDGVGNLLTETDALSRVTTYTYDANDNVATITDALDGVTAFIYDAEDNLTSVTDANGHTTEFEYDLDGLMTLLIEAGGQETAYEYDAAHNLTILTNAKGNAWTYSYDVLNRRTSEIDPLDNVTLYAYDLLNRLTSLTDANGVATAYEYDPLDRLTAVIQNHLSGQPADHESNIRTSYTYDGVGSLLTITGGNGETTTFTYDLLRRLT
ncbi:MAG: hypothetical protein GY796_32790, partial [Chloroflexi bacterium]|nr:hypothetical protein [Chloroflexota bacterium]